MDINKKLVVLADSAKYDVACTSSGANRRTRGSMGNTMPAGCCHSFAADGRCISLLKVLLSNDCIYDCAYCINRCSNDVPRASFTPQELAKLTIEFYRRNYIEGLFLSSGVYRNPDYTMEQMIETVRLLRDVYHFSGYVHAKTIPHASSALVHKLGLLVDRMSVNIELPSETSLNKLAPNKTKESILKPMQLIANASQQNAKDLTVYKNSPHFVPAGQSTQMIIGASPETDYQILNLTEGLYNKYKLKRVFYSAYIPVSNSRLLPALQTPPPMLREHRLYQADWLLRFYDFEANEILNEETPNFNPYLDPKSNWAVNNMQNFPVDINIAPLKDLLRVPGIGPKSARKILIARKNMRLDTLALKRLGVVLKRARYFIVTADKPTGIKFTPADTLRALIDPKTQVAEVEQLSLFDVQGQSVHSVTPQAKQSDKKEIIEDAITCMAKNF